MAAVKTAHSYFPLKYIQSWSKQSGRERGDYIVLKSTYLDNNGEECPYMPQVGTIKSVRRLYRIVALLLK